MAKFRRFPSPYGDFVFQQAVGREVICPACKAFPSPYGDFVFQLKVEIGIAREGRKEFPSPYGDFVFQHLPFAAALDELL